MIDKTKVDTGGYVHPFVNISEIQGITRRDWLQGQIIKGLVSNPQCMTEDLMQKIAVGEVGGKFFIGCSEKLADAMIAEGRK